MKQQCYMIMIYFNWIFYIGLSAFLLYTGEYLYAGAFILFMPVFMWLYLKFFPGMSAILGYGRVNDAPAERLDQVTTDVTLYTALSCPFCPIVEKRLIDLKDKMKFNLSKVDITLKAGIIKQKNIRAVPVIEANGRFLTGNATSKQLAELILDVKPQD